MTEPRVSVVVVDDDGAVRRGLTRLLRVSGYDVETFASARAFIEHGDYGRVTCLRVGDGVQPRVPAHGRRTAGGLAAAGDALRPVALQ